MSDDSNPIGINEAIKKAIEYFSLMYASNSHKVKDVMLEEVRESKDGLSWLITVGFSHPGNYSPDPLGVRHVIAPSWQRDYKVIELEKTTGEFKSMTIREGLETHG